MEENWECCERNVWRQKVNAWVFQRGSEVPPLTKSKQQKDFSDRNEPFCLSLCLPPARPTRNSFLEHFEIQTRAKACPKSAVGHLWEWPESSCICATPVREKWPALSKDYGVITLPPPPILKNKEQGRCFILLLYNILVFDNIVCPQPSVSTFF